MLDGSIQFQQPQSVAGNLLTSAMVGRPNINGLKAANYSLTQAIFLVIGLGEKFHLMV